MRTSSLKTLSQSLRSENFFLFSDFQLHLRCVQPISGENKNLITELQIPIGIAIVNAYSCLSSLIIMANLATLCAIG